MYWSAGRTFAVKFVTEPQTLNDDDGLPLDDVEKTWYEVAPVKYEYLIDLTDEYLIDLTEDDDQDGR